jgi:uncharacterized phage protein gp47/JayE
MNLSLKSFSQLVEDMGAALQSSATALIDLSAGSVIRAIFEANASVVLWLQWLILLLLQTTRAATSTGSDLDSWMADFGLTRLPASPSSGIVTFSRYADNLAALIPVGAVVKTADGSVSFKVTEDTAISIWQSAQSGYILPSGLSAADLPVTCTTAGTVGNVLAGTITIISASLPGVDLVTNASPFTNDIDAESDQSFRARFQNYLGSLSRATLTAARSAIANVQQGLNVMIQENTAADGSAETGFFLVTVDDGSGYPPSSLLSSVATAVDSVRPVGTMFAVLPPRVLTVNVTLTAFIKSTAVSSRCVSNIQTQVASYLNSLPIGRVASVTRVAQSAYSAGSDIENISAVLLNGLSSDVLPPSRTVVKAGSIVVTINDG